MKAGAHDYVMKDKLARLVPAVEREIREAASRAQRRQADQALAESRKLLENITRSLGEGLLVQDTNGRLLLMNAEAEALLGWTQAELAQRSVGDTIDYRHPDRMPLPAEGRAPFPAASKGAAWRAEDQLFMRKDGTAFPVTFVATPIIEEGRVVGTVTAFQDITARKRAERELQESRHRLQELSAFLQQVREEERSRIARELHDELGQALTALRIDLIWLDGKRAGARPQGRRKLAAMLTLVAKTVDAVRRISEDLRPGMLDDLGLAAAIEHHVSKFADQTGIACELAMSREHYELDDPTATTLFRIVQEALTNVARHASASTVAVQLQDLPDEDPAGGERRWLRLAGFLSRQEENLRPARHAGTGQIAGRRAGYCQRTGPGHTHRSQPSFQDGDTSAMIRILIADDHTILRDGLKQILSECSDMVVAGEADNGFDALAKVRAQDWDVVVLDMAMPGKSGIDLVKQIKSEKPKLPLLILSMQKESQYAVRSLKAGASGYLCKDSASADLVKAIRKVASGGMFISATMAESLALGLTTQNDALPHALLTDREYQVFRLIAAGMGTTAIGHQLHLSVKTISTHKTRIMQKMNFTNPTDLIRYALKHGLIDDTGQPPD